MLRNTRPSTCCCLFHFDCIYLILALGKQNKTQRKKTLPNTPQCIESPHDFDSIFGRTHFLHTQKVNIAGIYNLINIFGIQGYQQEDP